MKSIVILYHNDEDGFGGAWAAWKKFKDKASYFPMRYQTPIPVGIRGKEVYFIDFCPREVKLMDKILRENRKVVIIDHHESQIGIGYKYSSEFVYSDKNSGCVLAWDYFHPKKETPRLLRHVEDMDLWKFKKNFTKEILASLSTYDFDFKVWNKIAGDLDKPEIAKKYIDEGKAIIKYKKVIVKRLAERGINCMMEGKKAIAVNSPILESEIGHFIYENKKKDIGIVWSYNKDGVMGVSLRSGKDIDVSKIAKKYGGGGHKQASGFRKKVNFKFPWEAVEKDNK